MLNRIDECVYFYPLERAAVRRIIDNILEGLRSRLRDRRIELQLTPAVYDVLLSEGYDPVYGAREMARVIERRIVQPLGQALLAGKFHEGDAIEVRIENGRLKFKQIPA